MDEKKGISGSELVKLSDNPLFAMSLGGKELFHSNFLFWLLSTSSLKKATKELREWLFGEKTIDILWGERERCNFDLLFQYKCKDALEFRFLVVENKFKSIPRIEQLCEYTEKILKGIAVGKKMRMDSRNTSGVLLVPSSDLFSFSNSLPDDAKTECGDKSFFIHRKSDTEITIGDGKHEVDWKLLDYAALLQKLPKFQRTSSLNHVIKLYFNFTDTLLKELNTLQNPESALLSITHANTEKMESYRELRIDDLMGKYAFQIIEQAIDSTGKLPRGYVDFTRGQPCLTYRWALDGKHPQTPKEWDATPHYGLQIQAQSLRAFFHLNPQQHDFVDANSAQKSIKEEYNGILLKLFGNATDPVNNARHYSNCRSFQMRDGFVFFYQQIKLENVHNISELAEKLINLGGQFQSLISGNKKLN